MSGLYLAAEPYPLWSLASFLVFADHGAAGFALSGTFEAVQWGCWDAFLRVFVVRSGARVIKHVCFASLGVCLHSPVPACLLVFISSSLS